MNHKERTALIVKDYSSISIARQTELLAISRRSMYYQSVIDEQDIRIMRVIDEIYTASPFYGSRRVKATLEDYDIHICRDHVRRLMRLMGLEAIYPKKRMNTSIADNSHRKYPYLLNGIIPSYPNQIWGTDITYVRLEERWAYLTAILDWFSRYVLAWELSPTLETRFCITTLERALEAGTPTFHNSDQGVQFTDKNYTAVLEEQGINISMDGRGRCMDNIFTERLWKTVKYENIFLKSYLDIGEARKGLGDYFQFYNTKRKHQSLKYQTPAAIFFNR